MRGTGAATIGDCSFDIEYSVEDVREAVRGLNAERLALADRLDDLQSVIDASDRELAFVDSVATFLTTASGPENQAAAQSRAIDMDPANWIRISAFYRDRVSVLAAEKRNAARGLRQLQAELETVDGRLSSLGRARRKSNVIRVELDMRAEGRVSLDLGCMVTGPSWRPVYDIRVDSDGSKMALEMRALVRQASGEDWSGIELRLSTARIDVSGTVPELEALRLNLYRPRPSSNRSYTSLEMKKEAMMSAPAPSRSMADAEPDESAIEEPMLFDSATVESGGASVLFTIAGGSGIGGNGKECRVTVMRREIPLTLSYRTVPKLAEFAYLSGKARNDTDYPFLPGKANVFLDGSFVSVTDLALVMPGQEIEVSLGVDEGVRVEYRILKRFMKNEGLLAKRKSEQFDYEIRVTNNRKATVSIAVEDQFPISQEQEITVKQLKPAIGQGKDGPSLDDESRIQWTVRIEPGKKVELPVSWLVEYPRDGRLSGI